MGPDDDVCLCFRVTRRKLETFTRVRRPRVASQLSECGGAGTGCGWCVPILQQIHRRGTVPDDEPLTAEEYARRRGDYLRGGHGTPPADGLDRSPSPLGGEGIGVRGMSLPTGSRHSSQESPDPSPPAPLPQGERGENPNPDG